MSTVHVSPPLADTALRRRVLRRLRAQPAARDALGLLALIALVALLAPLLAPQSPYGLAAIDAMDDRLAPGARGAAGFTFWLGSDAQGRDVLSAILYGLRTSLFVGLCATAVALLAGFSVGLAAAQLGGRLDAVLMCGADILLGFPPFLVALFLLAAIGRGENEVILAIAFVQWAGYARLTRAAAVLERRKAYMEAAVNQGLPTLHIMRAHLMPNSIGSVPVAATAGVASAIALEATLSFLGVGMPATEPSLGLLIAGGLAFLTTGEYWIPVFPGLALLGLILSINVVGERLRRRFEARPL